jgi:hypothetical protein
VINLNRFWYIIHKNPRALKGSNKNLFPVVWCANRKSWVTKQIFADYVRNYLSPFIAKYSAENNLTNKALLIIDNALGHPTSVVDCGENIQVAFLPPNITSILQPMNQGVISALKSYYLQLGMKIIADGLDSNEIATDKKNYGSNTT